MLATAGGWGTTSAYSICLQDYYSFANNRPAGYQQLSNSSKPLFYLRGGGVYTIYTDYDTGAWTIYTASTTMNSETFAPTTTAPGVSLNRSTVIANLNGNASSVGGYSVWVGTQAQYNALSSKSNTTLYYITG